MIIQCLKLAEEIYFWILCRIRWMFGPYRHLKLSFIFKNNDISLVPLFSWKQKLLLRIVVQSLEKACFDKMSRLVRNVSMFSIQKNMAIGMLRQPKFRSIKGTYAEITRICTCATLWCPNSNDDCVPRDRFLTQAGGQKLCELSFGPRQANLVLIAYASSEGSGEPAHPRILARTSAARSYKQWVKRNFRQKARSLALWMAGHAQLKFVMTECSKTQIRLTRPISTLYFKNKYKGKKITFPAKFSPDL